MYLTIDLKNYIYIYIIFSNSDGRINSNDQNLPIFYLASQSIDENKTPWKASRFLIAAGQCIGYNT